MTRTLKAFLAALLQVGRLKITGTIGLMMLLSLTEGVGIALVIPLLQASGLNLAGQGAVGHFARMIAAAFAAVGLRPTLALLLVLVASLIGARAVIGQFESVAMYSVQRNFGLLLRRRLYRAIIDANWPFLSTTRSSDLIHAIIAEVSRVETAARYALMLVSSSLLFALYLAIAFKLSAAMTVVVLASGGLLVLLLNRRTALLHLAGEELSCATQKLYAATVEHLQALKTIKAYSAQDRDLRIFHDLSADLSRTSIKSATQEAVAVSLFEIGSAVIMAITLYVAIQVMAVQPAVILILLLMFARVLPRVRSSHHYYRNLLNNLPAFANVVALGQKCAAAAEPLPRAGAGLAFKTAVRFERVSFAYRSYNPPTVRALDIAIRAGEVVALVGPSGAGKSTIADLLMGLLTPNSGRITVDGVTLDLERLRAWREQLGYVAQDTFLFHDTIRENLLWARPGANDKQLREALELASADGFVARLPQGLDSTVGDRGVLLSHGERQRLALARALLRRPRLLILDEATNSLDAHNEEKILGAIERLRGELTIVMIAHRLAVVRWADAIYVVEDGTVVESGRWNELRAREDGRFRRLCESQGIVPLPTPIEC